jgi:O-antigen/teichoic acid export membrane protein
MSETTPKAEAAVVAGRGALFIGFAKLYFMFSGFLQQVLLPRLVGAAGFGAFSVVNNVISIVNNTMVQATVQAVSKYTAEDDARAGAVQRAGLKMQVVLGAALTVAMLLGAPLIASFEAAPQYTSYFRIAALIPFIYAVYAVFVGSANGLRRFHVQASFDVGFSTAKTILLLACAFFWHVSGAFIGFVAAAVVILIVASQVMRLPTAPGTSFPLRTLGSYMGAVVAYGLLLNVALNYDLPLLHHFAGTATDATVAARLAGHYQALRTLALLPFQALLVVTFVIFPLVSQATFAADRDATRAYVTQTLRYALILAGVMGIALAARPAALLGIIYKPEYGEGALALPILVAGECCLALLAVGCAILNAAGDTRATVSLMAVTVAVGSAAAALLVPRAPIGAEMLMAAATATALGMAAGCVAAIIYLRTRLGGAIPAGTVARVAAALAAGAIMARLVPGHGKVAGLAATLLAAIAYVAVLVVAREFGPDDRAKFARVLMRRKAK